MSSGAELARDRRLAAAIDLGLLDQNIAQVERLAGLDGEAVVQYWPACGAGLGADPVCNAVGCAGDKRGEEDLPPGI
jgi:hypothetical protein